MLKIRLRRMGNRNRPFYRIIVSDSRKAPSSSAIAEVGYYDPTKGPDAYKIDAESVNDWIAKGARVSPTVKRLLAKRPTAAAEPAA